MAKKKHKRKEAAPSVPVPVVTSNNPPPTGRLAWLQQQLGLTALIKATITLGILGLIPGAWMVGLPVLTIYGLIKREKVAKGIRRFFSFRSEEQAANNAARSLGDKTADFIITYYAGILRWFATLIMFFTMPIGFGLLAAYGLLRFTTNEWLDIFQRRCNDIYNFVISAINRFIQDASLRSKVILATTVGVLLGLSVLMSGIGILLSYSITVCQLAAVLVGSTALIRDIGYAIYNPGIVLTKNSGKIAGTLWGRWLAYRIFPGQISGSMGPAVGQVQSYGVFSSLFGSFLAPEGWFVFNSGGILGVLFSRIATFFNSIFTNIFVSESLQIQGDFFGIIGPSPLQLIAMMAVGCLVGYAVEKFVDSLCHEAAKDGKKVADASVRKAKIANNKVLNGLYHSRWALGFIAGTTPLIVGYSTAGTLLLELVGGSVIGASALTVAGLATALCAIYGIGMGVKSLADKARAREQAAQTPANQPQPTTSVTKPDATKPEATKSAKKTQTDAKTKTFTPGFSKSKAKSNKAGERQPTRQSPRLQKAAGR